ncbi:MAG: hypothetical protein JW757_03450 [Anaerolineales bacterium]|nr:hypothetical protein [Anaerolineales bacterium]
MTHTTETQNPLRQLFWIIVLISALFFTAVFISEFYPSLDWPLTSDNALLSYPSWMIHTGKIPYKEIFDFNLPGSYLVHIFLIKLFGQKLAMGYRLAELLVLLGIFSTPLLTLKLAAWKKILLVGISLIFSNRILIQGPNMAFQRDTWIALGMGVYLAKVYLDLNQKAILIRGRDYTQIFDFLTNFLLGFLATVKPSTVLLGIILILVQKSARRKIISAIGLGLPLLLVVVWLGAVGGLEDFLEIFFKYTLPLYPNINTYTPFYHTRPEFMLNIPLILGGLGSLAAFFYHKETKTGLILLSGVLFGIFHIYLQQKGHIYHFFPLLAAFVIAQIYGIVLADHKNHKSLMIFIISVLIMEIALQTFMILPQYNKDFHKNSETQNAIRYSAVLTSTTSEDDTIMIFDVGHGLSTAMYWQKRPLCGRFLYDLVFFHDQDDPYMRTIHNELLEKVASQQCSVIIVSDRGFGNFPQVDSPQRIGLIDGLDELLEKYYQLVESEMGRVYVLKEK